MSEGMGNFDDSELEDIMREMEELEREKAPSSPEKIDERVNEKIDRDIKTDAETDHDAEGPSRLENIIGKGLSKFGQVTPLGKGKGGDREPGDGPTTMCLNITGQIELQLFFNSSGHDIKIYVAEGKGLEIETGDGAKFSIPFESSLKKVA